MGYPIYISEIDHSFTVTNGGTRGPVERLLDGVRSARDFFTRRKKEPSAAPPTDRAAAGSLHELTALSSTSPAHTPDSDLDSPLADGFPHFPRSAADEDFEEIELVENTPIGALFAFDDDDDVAGAGAAPDAISPLPPSINTALLAGLA